MITQVIIHAFNVFTHKKYNDKRLKSELSGVHNKTSILKKKKKGI